MLISPCRQENEYIVRLRDGHTIDSHFARIGRDLSRDAHMFWPIDTLNGYRARLDDYTLHELVRYDPGVESVEHDSYGEPILEHEQGQTVPIPDAQPTKLSRRWAQTVHTGYHWWSVMISAGKKLDAPLPPKGDYVRTFQVTAMTTDGANRKV